MPAPQTTSAVVVQSITILKNGAPASRISNILAGGTVTIDVTAAIGRTISFSCLDPDGVLTPATDGTGAGALSPYGVEIAVSVGYQEGTTAPVMWPMGVFGVVSVKTLDTATKGGPVLTVTGNDRSFRVASALFSDTFTVAEGTTVSTAIQEIVASQAPWLVARHIAPTDVTVAQQIYSAGTDPWTAILTLAAAAGMVAYFDEGGALIVRLAPSAAGSPVVLYIEPGDASTLHSITSDVSMTPGYNGVIVTGSSVSLTTAVSGSAYTMNPNSPLYALGAVGKRPAPPISVTTATTNTQCAAIAKAVLPQVLGASRSVGADIIPAWFLSAYSLIHLANPTVKVSSTFILQQATVPLDYSTLMAITCVPLGTPLVQLEALTGASIAQFGSKSMLAAGGGYYSTTKYRSWTTPTSTYKTKWTTTGKTTWKTTTGKTTTGGSGGSSLGSTGGIGGIGGFGGGGFFSGGGLFRVFRRGWGGSSDTGEAEAVGDEGIEDVEDL